MRWQVDDTHKYNGVEMEALNHPIYQSPRKIRAPLLEAILEAELLIDGFRATGGMFETGQIMREWAWVMYVKEHLGRYARRYVAIKGPAVRTEFDGNGDWEYDLIKVRARVPPPHRAARLLSSSPWF